MSFQKHFKHSSLAKRFTFKVLFSVIIWLGIPADYGAGYPEAKADSADTLHINVHFNVDDHQLNREAQEKLSSFTAQLKELANKDEIRFHLQGHTCDLADSLYNIRLSRNRVEAVAQYLEKEGFINDSIALSFHGFNRPAVPNTTEEKRSRNRRVEIRATYPLRTDPPELQPIEKLFKPLQEPPETYHIYQDRDTLIKTKQGAIIYIRAGTFDIPEDAQDSFVTFNVKEIWSLDRIMANNLTTITTNDQILSSHSMFQLSATIDGEEVENRAPITVFAPTREGRPGMDWFQGERNEEYDMEWGNRRDGFYQSGRVCSNLGGCLEQCNFFCKIGRFFAELFSENPVQATIDELNEQDRERLRELHEDMETDRMSELINESRDYYIFDAVLGWNNKDIPVLATDPVTIIAEYRTDPDIKFMIAMPAYRAWVPMNRVNGEYRRTDLPEDIEIMIFGLKMIDDIPRMYYKKYTTTEDLVLSDIEFEKLSFEELANQFEQFTQ